MLPTLALKLFLVPSLIVLITLAGRRWGPGVAGWLSAFPVVAGPILLTIAIEQGAGFAARAAQGTLLAVVATLSFCLAYAWASTRLGVAGSVAGALAAWALVASVLNLIHPAVMPAALAVLACLLAAPRLFPSVAAPGTAGQPARDMLWRMLSAGALVLAVTLSAARLGPQLSGTLAMFPVMGTVLTTFAHARQGRSHAVALLRGMALGFFAFAAFCLTLALMLGQVGLAAAFTSAFCAALIVQLTLKVLVSASGNIIAERR
jgi:uncharacterized membrane protein (GlpM family)